MNTLLKEYSKEDLINHLVSTFIDQHNIKTQNKLILECVEKSKKTGSSISLNFDYSFTAIQREFESLVGDEDRIKHGIVYTPGFIVDYIVNKTVNKNSMSICDPSCGAGIFLVNATKRLHKLTGRPISEIIEQNIYGTDILEEHVKYCKILLTLFMLSTGEDQKELVFNLRVCNSLTFDWGVEYPAGFDAIIGNPPWDKIKILEREFFATRAPEIANMSTASKRKKMIQALEKKNPILHMEYIDAKNNAKIQSKSLRTSSKFQFSAVGELNLYSMFLELSHNMLKSDGLLGMIMPTGILTDSSYQKFFEHLTSTSSIIACHDFTNKYKIFKDVEENMRFCLMFLTSEQSGGDHFLLSILNEKIEDIGKHISEINKNDLILFNPNTKTCPLFTNERDYKICKKIYQNNDVLTNIYEHTNPWNLDYWRMFDMTNDSKSFIQKELLINKGFTKDENSWFIKNNLKFIPLYESKLFSNFEHRYGSFEGVSGEKRFGVKAKPNNPNTEQKQNNEYEIEPRYWVSEKEVLSKFESKKINPGCCFVFRDVCRTFTDSRTARGTIIPFSGIGNTAPVLIFRNPKENMRKKEMVLFSQIFSSFVFDYIVRQKISGSHLSKYILEQIAFPTPIILNNTKLKFNNEIKTADEWMLKSASKIYPVTQSFQDLFDILNINAPIIWNEDDRFNQICFINALIGHVYGVNKNDFEYILNQFPILKKQENKKYGEFISLNKCVNYFTKIQVIN